MGRHLGWARARRPALSIGMPLVGTLLAVLVTASPACAADPTPAPDPFATPVATPSVSPPSQEQIDDAKQAMDRLRNRGRATPTSSTRVAGPSADEGRGPVTARISDGAWWTLGAGLLVLLVVSETTRLGVRRAKHRRQA